MIALAAILSLNSCESWINGSVREIELPEFDPVLAPFLFINSSDTMIKVTVSQTTSVLDQYSPRLVRNATIEIWRDNNLIYTIDSSYFNLGTRKYEYPLTGQFGNIGNVYELKVNAPGFEEVTSIQTIPSLVKIDTSNIVRGGYVDPLEGVMDEIKLEFTDPADEENYYMVMLHEELIDSNWQDGGYTIDQWVQWLSSKEVFVESGYDFSIFNDLSFNGSQIEVNFGSWLGDAPLDKYYFQLISVSKETYAYLKSYIAYDNSAGNPFAEPTLLYNNIIDGVGFFGVNADDFDLIEE